jgi:hypothetical protein
VAENWPQINPVVLEALVTEANALRAAVRRVRELCEGVPWGGSLDVNDVRAALVEPPAETCAFPADTCNCDFGSCHHPAAANCGWAASAMLPDVDEDDDGAAGSATPPAEAWHQYKPMWRTDTGSCAAVVPGTMFRCGQREDHPVHSQPAPPAVVDFGWMSFAPATQDAITAAATCPCRTHPCSCDQRAGADQGDDN